MAKFFTPARLSENIRETPEGFLLCLSVPIARTGWQEYGPGETPLEVGEDGKVWIHRDKSEVLKPQTIASFNGKSVTIKHPQDFVAPKNWKMLTHGTAQNVRAAEEQDEDGEWPLLADLLVTDDFAIGLVKNGLREVSCGYDAEYEQTGEGEGRQFNIVGNHIALVEQGRAGPAYAIRDHKGEESTMSFKTIAETLKSLTKTVDKAVEKEKRAEDLKAKKAKSAAAKDSKEDEDKDKAKDDAAPEQVTYDDVMKAVKDLSDKMEKMGASKKEDKEAPEASDEDMEDEAPEMEEHEDAEVGQNSRLDKLEAAVAKILEALGNKGAEDEEEESEEDMSGSEDSDEEESEEANDEEGEEGEESQKKMVGDAARIEILTPGKKFTGKDARVKCLKEFAKTEEGTEILKRVGLEKPVFDSKINADMVFMAASSLVKVERGTGLKGTKDGKRFKSEDAGDNTNAPKTAEDLNEINAKHYAAAK